MLVSEPHFESRESFRALARAFKTGAERAGQRGRPVLVSVTLPSPSIDPIQFFENGVAVDSNRLLWTQPDDGLTLVGAGTASAVTGSGQSRFAAARQAWERLLADAHVECPVDLPGTGPVLVGGFSFDPLTRSSGMWDGYPDALLALPRFLLTTVSSHGTGATGLSATSSFTVNALVEPGRDADELAAAAWRAKDALTEPSPPGGSAPNDEGDRQSDLTVQDVRSEEWKRAVEMLASDVRAGRLEKAALARSVRVVAPRGISVGRALRALRDAYPDCRLFAVARGTKCFMGATPERLVRLARGKVEAMCLAGTIARGATEAEDEKLGQELRTSAKNGTEHAVVVRMLKEALSGVCLDVSSPSEPTLLKLPNVQHLHTPVTARLRSGRTLLDVVESVHPTPAVGGFPREDALAWIRRHEGLDRGWYAGPIGWIDQSGDGEFAVAIRSALVDGATASLFAGCGIVADSTPTSEYEESQWKLRPMLTALSAATRGAADRADGAARGSAR